MMINGNRVSFAKTYVPRYNRHYFTVYSKNALTNKEVWELLERKYGLTASTYGTLLVNRNRIESRYSLYYGRGYRYSSKVRVDFGYGFDAKPIDSPKIGRPKAVRATKPETVTQLVNVTELIDKLKAATGAKNVTLVW